MSTVRFFQIRLLVNICGIGNAKKFSTNKRSNDRLELYSNLNDLFWTSRVAHLLHFINPDGEILAPLIDVVHQPKRQILEQIWKFWFKDHCCHDVVFDGHKVMNYASFLNKGAQKILHGTEFSYETILKSVLSPDEHRQVWRRQRAFLLRRPARRTQTSEWRHSWKQDKLVTCQEDSIVIFIFPLIMNELFFF